MMWFTISAMATTRRTALAPMAARKVIADDMEPGTSFTLCLRRDAGQGTGGTKRPRAHPDDECPAGGHGTPEEQESRVCERPPHGHGPTAPQNAGATDIISRMQPPVKRQFTNSRMTLLTGTTARGGRPGRGAARVRGTRAPRPILPSCRE